MPTETDIISPASVFKGVVHKFIVVPVISLYNDTGLMIGERQLTPITIYEAKVADVTNLKFQVEEKFNAEIQKANPRR